MSELREAAKAVVDAKDNPLNSIEDIEQVVERLRAVLSAPDDAEPKTVAFKLGDIVEKVRGSEWVGTVCGTYSTDLTPEGYCVESLAHVGSVQIYPATALKLLMLGTRENGENL